MQALVDIKFEELLKVVKKLPEQQLSKLKAEIEKENTQTTNREELETLLLNGPVFSKRQLNNIAKARKAINEWRTN